MFRFLEKLHEKLHDTLLMGIYHVLDVYLSSDRTRTIVARVIMFTTVVVFSLLLYFTLTRWLPASKKMLDFTATDYRTPEGITSQPPLDSQPVEPIPVEKDIHY